MDSRGHGTRSQVLGSLLAGSGMQANLVSDAHLASLAIEHGLILCSTDGDFARLSKFALAKSAFGLAEHSAVGNLGLVALKGQPNPAGIFKVA